MENYLYLLIDFSCIIIPLLASFHPKLQFYKEWKAYLPAMFIVAIVFLIWDELFTSAGIWGFNNQYITGIQVGHLPIEELLFFICIPYACVFTYFAVRTHWSDHFLYKRSNFIGQFLLTLAFILAAMNFEKWYTLITFGLLVITLAVWKRVNDWKYLSTITFSYLLILPFFFISNGLLTGFGIENEVVWYNNEENIGERMATIPFEDLFYGFLLICWNVLLYEYFRNQLYNKEKRLTPE